MSTEQGVKLEEASCSSAENITDTETTGCKQELDLSLGNVPAVSDEVNEEFDLSIRNIPLAYKKTYEAYVRKLRAISTIPIIKSVSEDAITNFQHYNFRYYEDKYCVYFGVSETGYHDTLIRIHSNKLLLVALANGNDLLTNGKNIVGINFIINNNDRGKVEVKGKSKKGSKVIESHTILCQVKCEGESKLYNVRAGVKGRIIEINEKIKENPGLLRTSPKGLGFIAVIAPKGRPTEYENQIRKLGLLSEEEYGEHLLKRAGVL